MNFFNHNIKIPILILIKLIKRNYLTVLIVAALLILAIVGFSKFGNQIFNQNTLTEGMIGTYQGHDLPDTVTRLLSRSLVVFDKDGRVVPDLAESWQANKEVNQFTFKIKDNQFWADGSRIKSSDLEYGIEDVDVSYPSDNTIVFKLKEPFAPLPSLLTKPVFKKGTFLGTGPYKVKKTQISRIFLTKLELEPQTKNLPNLTIRFYPNEKTALTAISIGEIQALLGVNDFKLINSSPILKLKQKTNFSKIVSILYNTKDPLLSNRSLRQALSYSAPEIPGEQVATTSIPPFSWAYTEEVNDYLSNDKAAKAALERAKSNLNSDDLQKEITLTTIPQYSELGKTIVDDWNKLGIKAILRIESGIPQNFQALLIAQTIPTDPDQYALWHSTQTKTNLTGYDSKRVDKDLEDGRETLDEKVRKDNYIDFQKALLEDSPATFLYFPKFNVMYMKKAESKLNQLLPLQLP